MLSMLPDWNPFPAVLKGRIRLKSNDSTNPVAVGDHVLFETGAETPGEVTLENPALITEILDRKNFVVRKSTNLSRQSHVIAANIDMVLAGCPLFCFLVSKRLTKCKLSKKSICEVCEKERKMGQKNTEDIKNMEMKDQTVQSMTLHLMENRKAYGYTT